MDKLSNDDSLSLLQSINLKRKPDGTPYKSRLEMKKEYDESVLPYPLKAIWKLDYCWNIIKSHLLNCFFFSLPLTIVYTYSFNPKIRTEGMKSKPFIYYISAYILVYSIISSYFVIDALIFCDYCKPWSPVYLSNNKSESYKEILKSRIKREQGEYSVQLKKTRDRGLKDEEL